jgi:hypothetical protein
MSLPRSVDPNQPVVPVPKVLTSGKDVLMTLVNKNLITKTLTRNRLRRKVFTPRVDCRPGMKLDFRGYIAKHSPTQQSQRPATENSCMKSMLSNILNSIDNGIILLDSKLDGVYSNIKHVFTQETLSYSNVKEVINVDLLTENRIYNFKRIFQRNNVKELTVDLVSFQIVSKIYEYCCGKSLDPDFCLPELEDSM